MKRILKWELFLEELVGDKAISNYDEYNKGMAKSIDDKLFFISNLDFDVIVDFGCANGVFVEIKGNLTCVAVDEPDDVLSVFQVDINGVGA